MNRDTCIAGRSDLDDDDDDDDYDDDDDDEDGDDDGERWKLRSCRVHLSLNLEPYCAELSRVYGVNDILGKPVSSGYFVLTKKRKENKHLL